MAKPKRAALYLRVSTDGQSVENQRLALQAVAAQRGWSVVAGYDDNGISGAKGRDRRPGLDALLRDATRGRFDVVAGRMFFHITGAFAEFERDMIRSRVMRRGRPDLPAKGGEAGERCLIAPGGRRGDVCRSGVQPGLQRPQTK
jgi:DNA invertase Pin-like site-specific DNA recombinase